MDISKLIQILQFFLWLIPCITVIYVFSFKSGRSWNFIIAGYLMAFMRVNMKFLPWYKTIEGFPVLRYWMGIAAIMLIGFGFLNFYIKTLTLDSDEGIKLPYLLAFVSILSGIAYIWLSPPVTKLFITHLRNVEDVIWIIISAATIVLIVALKKHLEELPLYKGLVLLAVTFGIIIVWKSIGFQLRAFNIKVNSPDVYHFWHTIQETAEGLVGFGFGGAFIYMAKKMKI